MEKIKATEEMSRINERIKKEISENKGKVQGRRDILSEREVQRQMKEVIVVRGVEFVLVCCAVYWILPFYLLVQDISHILVFKFCFKYYFSSFFPFLSTYNFFFFFLLLNFYLFFHQLIRRRLKQLRSTD